MQVGPCTCLNEVLLHVQEHVFVILKYECIQ